MCANETENAKKHETMKVRVPVRVVVVPVVETLNIWFRPDKWPESPQHSMQSCAPLVLMPSFGPFVAADAADRSSRQCVARSGGQSF